MTAAAFPRKLLQQQDADTSNAILERFRESSDFRRLADFEGELTVRRDAEDGEKLQKGIDYAKSKGVLDPNYVPEPYVTVDVLGKTPQQVANIILDDLGSEAPQAGEESSETSGTGTVVVLVGLSGTGKGTTVSQLRSALEARGRQVVTWSNGNVFRSLTLLAVTWCEQNLPDGRFDVSQACTDDNLRTFASMLSFERDAARGYDTRICGLGLDVWVHDVQNTLLKSPAVATRIPAVAELTQGEVLAYATKAVDELKRAGYAVLLEGREQTVDYVRTPHRYSLTLSDPSLIGARRAAQRLMAAALAATANPGGGDDDDVSDAVGRSLEELVRELP